ncbi:hypothetical protein BX666DRAFT_1961159 [Dichotomocladium elegans]|nr:hypothetical protein BX666DRAFT_1961159 [Dichotomocladium elegans]
MLYTLLDGTCALKKCTSRQIVLYLSTSTILHYDLIVVIRETYRDKTDLHNSFHLCCIDQLCADLVIHALYFCSLKGNMTILFFATLVSIFIPPRLQHLAAFP